MTEKRKPKSAAPAAKRAAKGARRDAATKAASDVIGRGKPKAAEKTFAAGKAAKKAADAKTKKAGAKAAGSGGGAAAKRAEKTKKTIEKAQGPGTKRRTRKGGAGETEWYRIGEPVLDPVGDVSSGEARAYLGDGEPAAEAEMEAYRADTAIAAMDAGLEAGPGLEAIQAATEGRARQAAEAAAAQESGEQESRGESGHGASEPAKLERLQKILARAGIASRRHAEEMIVAGRVMVNGQVVTQLGSKADARRDHIRVDGKLLHGAERHRYFVLNKPRGYVTTVSDPEGRPTVIEFFAGFHERLFPVGRLDFQSEGLLLVTNDGELANLLTTAGSGVEKTYLVKVAGQPTEEELARLRSGVSIERGDGGPARVRTAPARIHRVRAGENPWYEVVLTEGRNRELRKMFAAIGHFAEKIRRVGYGPLALDVEPGKLRELTADEVNALRLTAEGKMKPRRLRIDWMLPKEAGVPAEKRSSRAWRGGSRGTNANSRVSESRPRAPGGFAEKRGQGGAKQWRREEQGQKKEWRPRKPESGGERREFRAGSGREFGGGPRREFGGSARREFGGRPREFGGGQRRERRDNRGGGRADFQSGERREFGGGRRRERGEGRGAEERRPFSERKPFGSRRPFGERKAFGGESRPFGERGGKPFLERDGERKRRDEFVKRSGGERTPLKRNDEGKKQFGGERGKGAKFGGKAGGFGRFRDNPTLGANARQGWGTRGRGRKFGGSRPGAARGGWKRG